MKTLLIVFPTFEKKNTLLNVIQENIDVKITKEIRKQDILLYERIGFIYQQFLKTL